MHRFESSYIFCLPRPRSSLKVNHPSLIGTIFASAHWKLWQRKITAKQKYELAHSGNLKHYSGDNPPADLVAPGVWRQQPLASLVPGHSQAAESSAAAEAGEQGWWTASPGSFLAAYTKQCLHLERVANRVSSTSWEQQLQGSWWFTTCINTSWMPPSYFSHACLMAFVCSIWGCEEKCPSQIEKTEIWDEQTS